MLARLAVIAVLGFSTVVVAQIKPKEPRPAPTLTITKLEPAKGDAEGGTYVRVTGTGFLLDAKAGSHTKIYFGSRQGTIVRFASDTELIVQAPGGKVGEKVDVLVVFEGRGEKKLEGAFTFVAKP